jgi:hypothetical protein
MRQAKRGDFTASCGLGGRHAQLSSAAAGKAERARKRAEAAARHAAELVSEDVADDERLDELSPPKKL